MSDSPRPRVSVVMPVYNAGPHLDEAVESILGQTLADFEFVILDDGSSDGTGQALQRWAERDTRIRLLRSDAPSGLPASSDRVVSAARAPICARMDGDDIALPDRLERQLEVLDRNPDAVMVSSLWEGIDTAGRKVRSRDRWRLIKRRPFAPFTHGSIMFRREAYEAIGGYREEANFWEDFEFYLRMSTQGRILVIPDVLFRYRFHTVNSRLTTDPRILTAAMNRMQRCADRYRNREDYGSELTGDLDPAESASSYAIFMIGSTRLWAGERPRILRPSLALLLRSFDRGAIKCLILAIAGGVAPGLLRSMLNLLVWTRDWIASREIQSGEPFEWRFE
ncbi:MAG TPA: glycosyltransferase family A protein [Thermoanaerobaculia bacterium]|nr:glycosyltransferase family A protein [Thermoanaerobaculia bacterium]